MILCILLLIIISLSYAWIWHSTSDLRARKGETDVCYCCGLVFTLEKDQEKVEVPMCSTCKHWAEKRK